MLLLILTPPQISVLPSAVRLIIGERTDIMALPVKKPMVLHEFLSLLYSFLIGKYSVVEPVTVHKANTLSIRHPGILIT